MARKVPLRRSLLVRLLATSVLVAIAAGAATTWLAVQSTSQALQRQQSQNVADEAGIYQELVGYAASHRTWDEVAGPVQELARRTERHIILTTPDRRPIADSNPSPAALPAVASALVDPLQVNPALSPGAAANGIDPRAVGPYALDELARGEVAEAANRAASCMTTRGYPAVVKMEPSGRSSVDLVDNSAKARQLLEQFCFPPGAPTQTERIALDQLNQLVAACLSARSQPEIQIAIDFSFFWSRAQRGDNQVAQECVDSGRRQQLAGYVAPQATLFIVDPAGSPAPSSGLSPAVLTRIVGVAALVLILAAAVTVIVGTRLVRPLRKLTEAAQQPAYEHVRVPVTTRDEIGHLAAAFNDMAERRERAEEQRTAMVNDIAHELRTPLTNIRGWLEAAEDGVATPDSDPALMSALLREARLLQRIVDDLQDLAAADAGMLRLYPEWVSVTDLLNQVATAHRGAAENAGVDLMTDITGRPELPADPVRLRQMVGNLVTNAIRHTPAGGKVTIRALQKDDVLIQVADTGSGLDAQYLPYVFDRFWRAEKSRSRQTGGSGLGLAIVRQFAHAHGGTVSAVSEKGAGSVFTLRLPLPRPDPGKRRD